MDITPQDNSTQPISDDQELAKALAGVLPEEEDTTKGEGSGMDFEETQSLTDMSLPQLPNLPGEHAATGDDTSAPDDAATTDATTDDTTTVPDLPTLDTTLPSPSLSPLSDNTGSFGGSANASTGSSELDSIKLDALKELRPLMDKVELPAEEKFDTYLMLIRSTDDSSLIQPAHTAAQNIGDEKRKAEALLEIIKEIDYLSRKEKPAES